MSIKITNKIRDASYIGSPDLEGIETTTTTAQIEYSSGYIGSPDLEGIETCH